MTTTTCAEEFLTIAPEPALATRTRSCAYTKPARRDSLLAQYDQSDLSARQFAEQSGIKCGTFRKWLVRRKRRQNLAGSDVGSGSKPVVWLEAVVQQIAPTNTGGLVLVFPGGVRAEVSSAASIELAAALVRALEKPC